MVLPLSIMLFSNLVFAPFGNAATTTKGPATGTACTQRYVNENGNSVTEHYQCPEYSDSPDQTLCCDKSTERCCLSPKVTKFYELPQQTAIIISVAVVLAAAIFIGIIITCVCWERCPLYTACRTEPMPDYIAKPDDVAVSLMPDDNAENARMYTPGKASSKSNY